MEFEEVEQDSDPIFAASIVGTPITSLVPVTDEEWVVHPTTKKPFKILESDTEEESDDDEITAINALACMHDPGSDIEA